MKQQIPWLRVLVEGVVIVVSILLAFGIEAWWDGVQEQAAEQELLASLEQDMLNNRAEVEGVLDFHQRADDALRVFLSMTPEALGTLPEDSASSLLQSLFNMSTFTPFEGTLRTADLSLVGDNQLREAVGSWIGMAANVSEDVPLMLQGWKDSYSGMESTALIRDMGYAVPSDGPTAPLALAGLRNDEEFLRSRLTHQYVLNVDREKSGVLLDQTNELLELISSHRR